MRPEPPEPAAHQVETGRIGQRSGDHLDRGDLLHRVEGIRHQQPGRPAQPGDTDRWATVRAALQVTMAAIRADAFHLLQEPLPVEQVAGGGVDDPVRVVTASSRLRPMARSPGG